MRERQDGSASARTARVKRMRAATGDDARRARTNTTKLVRRRAAEEDTPASPPPGQGGQTMSVPGLGDITWKSKFRRPKPSTYHETHWLMSTQATSRRRR